MSHVSSKKAKTGGVSTSRPTGEPVQCSSDVPSIAYDDPVPLPTPSQQVVNKSCMYEVTYD